MKRSYIALALFLLGLGMICGGTVSASDRMAEMDHYLASSADDIASSEIDYYLEAPAAVELAADEMDHYLEAPSIMAQIEELGIYAMRASAPVADEVDCYLEAAAPALAADEMDRYLDAAEEVQMSRADQVNDLVRQITLPNDYL